MPFWHPCQSLLEINSVTRGVRLLSTAFCKLTVIATEKPTQIKSIQQKATQNRKEKTKTSQSVIT
jgi:predicted 2-oxoglutarate/Fe(II)-dependent dioxygenase YbiX